MTNWKTFYNRIIRQVYLERGAEGFDAVGIARRELQNIDFRIVSDESEIPEEHLKGTTLYLRRHRGHQVGRCPGSHGHLCCNYHTIDLYAGCALGCSYCIMRSYLNFSPVTVYVDPEPAVQLVRELALQKKGETLRIGTGEVGDSLLYDPLFQLSEPFIRGLSDLDNVHFEMKSKTDFVDHLLDIEPKGNAVIGFSLNPPEIADLEEGIASAVQARIAAAKRVVEAGYRTSFHFDPVFRQANWRELYFPLIDSLAGFRKEAIAWISVGTFRYTPPLKDKIADRPYLYEEFVPSADGKHRYIQRVRAQMYRELIERLRAVTGVTAYLCMESAAIWKRVYGRMPDEVEELKGVFDDDPARLKG
ncbi:MAG: radical SAM protein [Spirochaetales bacterium]|nr:radical SAM protein [Spirochaetales bacterium]